MGTVNWELIEEKINAVVDTKITKAPAGGPAGPPLSDLMIKKMREAIISSAGLTENERQRILSVPFVNTGIDTQILGSSNGLVSVIYKLYFDFEGDKTMASLSPNKSVHDLIALFNNGYPTNNVDPKHPIRGMWHGTMIVIKPRSRKGAHFIGKALQDFKYECTAMYPNSVVTFNVNPNYNSTT